MLYRCWVTYFSQQYRDEGVHFTDRLTEAPRGEDIYSKTQWMTRGCPGGSEGKVSARRAGDLGLIPGWRRSTGEGNGTLLQYSCLENSRRILVGCSPSDGKELHMTEQLHFFTADGGGAIF